MWLRSVAVIVELEQIMQLVKVPADSIPLKKKRFFLQNEVKIKELMKKIELI